MIPDKIMKEYVLNHGGKIGITGMIRFSRTAYQRLPYRGVSIFQKPLRTLVVPSIYGTTLLLEKKHFIVDE